MIALFTHFGTGPELTRELVDLFTGQGIPVSYTWPPTDRGVVLDGDTERTQALKGVSKADVLIIVPDVAAAFENTDALDGASGVAAGIACALGKPVIIYGQQLDVPGPWTNLATFSTVPYGQKEALLRRYKELTT